MNFPRLYNPFLIVCLLLCMTTVVVNGTTLGVLGDLFSSSQDAIICDGTTLYIAPNDSALLSQEKYKTIKELMSYASIVGFAIVLLQWGFKVTQYISSHTSHNLLRSLFYILSFPLAYSFIVCLAIYKGDPNGYLHWIRITYESFLIINFQHFIEEFPAWIEGTTNVWETFVDSAFEQKTIGFWSVPPQTNVDKFRFTGWIYTTMTSREETDRFMYYIQQNITYFVSLRFLCTTAMMIFNFNAIISFIFNLLGVLSVLFYLYFLLIKLNSIRTSKNNGRVRFYPIQIAWFVLCAQELVLRVFFMIGFKENFTFLIEGDQDAFMDLCHNFAISLEMVLLCVLFNCHFSFSHLEKISGFNRKNSGYQELVSISSKKKEREKLRIDTSQIPDQGQVLGQVEVQTFKVEDQISTRRPEQFF